MTYSDQQKYEAVKREIRWRRRVYPNRVAEGRMTPQESDYQIKIFEEIAEDYRARSELPL